MSNLAVADGALAERNGIVEGFLGETRITEVIRAEEDQLCRLNGYQTRDGDLLGSQCEKEEQCDRWGRRSSCPAPA